MADEINKRTDYRKGEFLFTLSDIDKFFALVTKDEECWNWIGYKDKEGYARLTIRGNQLLGHVVSYLLHNGPIPSPLHVLHSCDNPTCVNPAHLWLGTHQDNMKDRDEKGRCGKSGRYGTMINSAKIDSTIAQEIIDCVEKGAKQRHMAKRFGISPSTVNALIKRRTWKQI